MTPKELATKTISDIRNRRKLADREFYGYQKEQSINKKRKWNIKVGGYRW